MSDTINDEVADKYEHKRTGLTIDEALEATILGYRVTCDELPAGSYIHYEFNGWRHEFSHNGRVGSSSAWTPEPRHSVVSWRIFELVKLDGWGKPVQAAPKRDNWGRPIDGK